MATQNVEIIIVDDASTDGTGEVLTTAFGEADNVTLKLKDKNKGQSDSRYLGLQEACGDYVYFMDSDDRLEPEFRSVILPTIKNQQADIVFFRLQGANAAGLNW
ncbi:glycosyltransferase family 2 protein [Secundilactobacillus kimchicus]|uniref:glycosyltransferase family 2 protein n=1 Tax=Secundilactobacillus kimchicus TaxID=528209 RepID=UPI000B0D60BF|nr:glycosyltransferase family A protein [Secundilactobacillus kimchicus]